MRITNVGSKKITFTDLDRGLGEAYTSWNEKGYSGVDVGESIDVFDSEKTMLSAEFGQVKKMVDAGYVTTDYSMTGNVSGNVTINTGVNDEFIVDWDGTGDQTFTLPSGELSMLDVVNTINATASGFVSEVSDGFFRSSNTDDTGSGEVDGILAKGMGPRTPAVTTGFLVLVGQGGTLLIGAGNANSTLGFIGGQKTTANVS